MKNEVLLAIKHIKEVSKKKVTIVKIESFSRKDKIEITDKLKKIVENMVSDTQEVSSEETVDSTQVEYTRQDSVTPDADSNKET